MEFKKNDISVDGSSNLTAGQNIIIIRGYANGIETNINLQEYFSKIDKIFRETIKKEGTIIQAGKKIDYSSRKLFESLMHIGMPLEVAIEIPKNIIPMLEEEKEKEPKRDLTTADIRLSVARCIDRFSLIENKEKGFDKEDVYRWSAAYIRRYGNPKSQFIKVIDCEEEKELNYDYIQKKIIPHLLRRIMGLDAKTRPEKEFQKVFTKETQGRISREILCFSNKLEIYQIRYKTLINILEDVALNPPHPWIVNKETISSVIDYNIERAEKHLKEIKSQKNKDIEIIYDLSTVDCIMHLCAAILANYGAFLGVGTKYGFLELRRILDLKSKNPAFWSYCKIKEIDKDLEKIGWCIESFSERLEKIKHCSDIKDPKKRCEELKKSAFELAEITTAFFEKNNDKISIQGLKSTIQNS